MAIGIGIDVASEKVDVGSSDGKLLAVYERNDSDLARLVQDLKGLDICRVVLEASGGYEQLVLTTLFAAGLPVVLVDARRARDFAKGTGRKAKTDKIDAKMLADMAVIGVDDVALWRPLESDLAELHDLVHRRTSLVVALHSETMRRRDAASSVAASLARGIAFLKGEIAEMERAINKIVRRSDRIRKATEALEGVKGVGRILATTLLTTVPELGTLGRNQIAALVGVAPMNVDSGKGSKRRFIQGGRAATRKALYMGALSGIRHNEHLRAYYTRLRERQVKGKVALVACMRKLLIHLNALMRVHLSQQELQAAS